MEERTTKTSEKNKSLKSYQTPRLTNYGQVEQLTNSGGNTTVDEDARKKNAG